MKKKFYIVVLVILSLYSIPTYAESKYSFIKPSFMITINDVQVENDNTNYPLLIYNDITYLPMTWNNSKSLGLEVRFDDKNIYINNTNYSYKFVNESVEKKTIGNFIANLPKRNIIVNGIKIENENQKFPVLMYNDILYFPLTYTYINNIFKFEISYAVNDGLRINSLNNIFKLNNENPIVSLVNNAADDTKTDIITSKNVYNTNNRAYIKNIESYVNRIEIEINNLTPEILDNGDKIYYKKDITGTTIGKYIWKNGNYYIGEFDPKYLNFKGVGLEVVKNSFKYIGEFKGEGKKELGVTYFDDGTASKITEFINGVDEEVNIKYTKKKSKIANNQKVLIIMTEFNDVKFKTSEKQWYNFFFGNDNSVKAFYKYTSNGTVNFIPVEETQNIKNDGIIRVTLNKNHYNYKDDVSKSDEVFIDSISEVDKYIDFKKYDLNNNGFIDSNELIIVNVVAGYEYVEDNADAPSIYAHMSSVSNSKLFLDETTISSFAMIGELNYDSSISPSTYMSTLAVACHEIGHIFDLLDLYDTDYTSEGVGPFSLMSTGTNLYTQNGKIGEIPIDFDPWSKEKLGFIKPINISTSGEYDLYSKNTGKYNVLRIDISKDEYFLLENRKFVDYDLALSKFASKSGVLIWHIDNSVINEKSNANEVNNDEDRKGVDLEEANESKNGYGLLDVNSKKNKDKFNPFFRSDTYNIFNNTSKPSSKLNNGKDSGISVEILEDGDVVKLKINIDN
ncbi:M6 family metalloprotease domain-containing protein [Helicovermis profundi]|uniref:EF-hand domain-containing protein n=1 Tax=Helicovermis profundi TaxID=3065157 RepID=A0AAU9EIJ1_9FIRM|nr:hypothetical protein HLPR_00350 [Clostridia bacterium S502]